MKTLLAVPPTWSLSGWDDDRFTLLVDGELGHGLTIEVGPPRFRAGQPAKLVAATLERGAAGSLQIARTTQQTTACGWTFDLVEAVVVVAGEVVEARMVAAFHFMDHTAVVLVRSQRRDLLQLHRGAIEDALATARPDWAEAGVSTLADLWAEEQSV